jgi:hypothetical protein
MRSTEGDCGCTAKRTCSVVLQDPEVSCPLFCSLYSASFFRLLRRLLASPDRVVPHVSKGAGAEVNCRVASCKYCSRRRAGLKACHRN